MGPQIDESSFEETTYLEYELKKAQEQLQQIGMGAVMMTVMHFNFQFFVPLVCGRRCDRFFLSYLPCL